MALLRFDATQVAPDTGMEALPAGWYNVMIVESEVKPTKDTTGLMLVMQYKVMDGQYANRLIFARFNIKNNNPVAQEIAYKQLSAVCHAVGVLQVEDSQLLHGKPFKVKVKVRKADENYEASNEPTAYKRIDEPTDGPAPPAALQQVAAAANAAPAGFAPQPWAQPAAAPSGFPPGFPGANTGAPPVAAPAVAPPVAPPAAPVAVAPALPPLKKMTAKAAGATYESFIAQGWTDAQMVGEGYMVLEQPAALPTPPAAPPAAPALPTPPVAPTAAPAVGPGATAALVPPWMQKPAG